MPTGLSVFLHLLRMNFDSCAAVTLKWSCVKSYKIGGWININNIRWELLIWIDWSQEDIPQANTCFAGLISWLDAWGAPKIGKRLRYQSFLWRRRMSLNSNVPTSIKWPCVKFVLGEVGWILITLVVLMIWFLFFNGISTFEGFLMLKPYT